MMSYHFEMDSGSTPSGSPLVFGVIIQTAFLGDVVLTTAFLRELLGSGEVHRLCVVTTAAGAEILKGFPHVECVVLDKRLSKGLLNKWKQLIEVRRQVLDAAKGASVVLYSPHRSFRSLFLGRMIPARSRTAFFSIWSLLFGYETATYPPYNERWPYALKLMALLPSMKGRGEALQEWPLSRVRPELFVERCPREQGESPTRTVILAPFSVWATKMWPLESFAVLARSFAVKGWSVVVVGGGDSPYGGCEAQRWEEAWEEQGQKLAGEALPLEEQERLLKGRVRNLVGRTPLDQLKSLVSQSDLVVSNDSALVHIAAGFDRPCVTLFGPTHPRWGFAPLSSRAAVLSVEGLGCRPCHIHGPQVCPLGHFRCMKELTVDQVWQACQDLFGSHQQEK